jgi:hypothetical protein
MWMRKDNGVKERQFEHQSVLKDRDDWTGCATRLETGVPIFYGLLSERSPANEHGMQHRNETARKADHRDMAVLDYIGVHCLPLMVVYA